MKIQRYQYGQSNVAQLDSQRANLIKAPEAAAAAMVPYEAVSSAAQNISNDLLKLQDQKIKTLNAEDAVKTGRSFEQFETERKLLYKQIAADPNASADDYEAGVANLVKEMTDRGEGISERNRKTYMERVGFVGGISLEEALIDGNTMRTEKSIQMLNESVANAVLDERYDAAAIQINMGVEENLYSQAEADEKIQEIEARKLGKKLGEGYLSAVANGTQDKYMQTVGDADLNDQALAFFGEEKKKIDLFSDQVNAEIKTEQALEFNDYRATISSQTDPETMKAWVRERTWLNNDQINSLYSAMRKGEETKAISFSIYSDRESKKTREAFNSELDLNQSPENVVMQAAAIANQYRVVPTAFTYLINNIATTEEPRSLIDAGNYVMQMEEAAPGINLHLNDLAMSKVNMYTDMVKRKVDPVLAATTVTNHYAGITEQVIDARKENYEKAGFGPDNLSPREFINNEFTRRLTDLDTQIGQTFAGDLGEGLFNLADRYQAKSVTFSPLMEDTLGTLAYNFYIAGAPEEIAIESAIKAARNMGFAATDINNEIIWAGETKYQYQIQQNPITRVGNQVYPQQQVRDIIAKDMGSTKFSRVNDPINAKPRAYSIDEIVVGDGVIDELDGPNKGNLKWPLLANGSQLTINGEPQFFWYPVVTKTEEEVAKEKALSDIQQQTLRSRISQMTGGVF